MCYTLLMCILLTLFDVSIEDKMIDGILYIELFPWQSSYTISLDMLCDKGLPWSTFNNPISI